MHFETVNHKLRAQELRTAAQELNRKGFPVFAEVNMEMAEWLDPTPREKEIKPPRRGRLSRTTGDARMNAPLTPAPSPIVQQRSPRGPQRITRMVPRGTQIIGRNDAGRVLRQVGTN